MVLINAATVLDIARPVPTVPQHARSGKRVPGYDDDANPPPNTYLGFVRQGRLLLLAQMPLVLAAANLE